MSVEKGTIYGFLGKNGAGKATVLGMDSVKNNLDILKRTGSLIEIPIFYEHLSAIKNLQIHLDYIGHHSPMVWLWEKFCCRKYLAAIIISTIMCQIMAMTMTSLVGTVGFLVVGGIIAIIAVKNLVRKVEKMEV